MLQRCSWPRARSRCRRWRPSMTRRWPDWQRTKGEHASMTVHGITHAGDCSHAKHATCSHTCLAKQ